MSVGIRRHQYFSLTARSVSSAPGALRGVEFLQVSRRAALGT